MRYTLTELGQGLRRNLSMHLAVVLTLFVSLTLVATTNVEERDAGLASGIFNTSQQIGGALGIAALSTVATTTTSDEVATGTALPNALTAGFESAFIWGAIVAGLGILVSVFLVRRSDLETPVEETPEPALEAAA